VHQNQIQTSIPRQNFEDDVMSEAYIAIPFRLTW